MIELLAGTPAPGLTGTYMLNRLKTFGTTVTTTNINTNPGSAWVHNGLGSIGFTDSRIVTSNSGVYPTKFMIGAAKDFEVKFNVYPTTQNMVILMGDLVNWDGTVTWGVILNRSSGNISQVEFLARDSTTGTTRTFGFGLTTKLAANAWSDVIIKRVSGTLSCTINNVAKETYSWNNGVTRYGTGMFTVGQSADLINRPDTIRLPLTGYINDLNITIQQ